MVSFSSTPSPGNESLLRIEYKPLTLLKAYPHNARTHSKRQVRQIADSIASFGFTNPILIDVESRRPWPDERLFSPTIPPTNDLTVHSDESVSVYATSLS
jgi:hypothetical protein